MPLKASKFIWHEGKLVPWEQATVHVLSHALHYGSSVFEGIRVYKTPTGAAGFRLTDHVRRLYDSAKIYRIKIPFTSDALVAAMSPASGTCIWLRGWRSLPSRWRAQNFHQGVRSSSGSACP